MRRWLRALLLVLPLCATLAAAAVVLRQNPFAAPLVERTAEETRLALSRALRRAPTQDRLRAMLADALAARDADRAAMLLALSVDYGPPLSPGLRADAEALVAAQEGLSARAGDCLTCMADITACPSLPLLAACAIPFELTPAGDLNALRRAAADRAAGRKVDLVEVNLALVGLGATALVVASGGSSGAVKAGAAALRMARRLGTLTPALAADLARAADMPVAWRALPRYLAGRAPLAEVADPGRLARLDALAGDLGRVRRNTSLADTLVLMRHVDDAEDAARLARLSDAAGPRTRGVLELLGKRRAFRALVRLSDLAWGAATLLYAALVQALALLANAVSNAAMRGLRRALRPVPAAA